MFQIPADIDFPHFLREIEDTYRGASVGKRTAPYLNVAIDDNGAGLFAQGVLVDGEHLVIAEEGDREIVHP